VIGYWHTESSYKFGLWYYSSSSGDKESLSYSAV
jgi:hypothetical protein